MLKKLKNKKNNIIVIICIITFLIIDQLTKFFLQQDMMVIQGILQFTSVNNSGAAFGVLQNNTIIIIFLNILLIGFMIRFLTKFQERASIVMKLSLLFIIAGGIGNLIDRIVKGYVVDFIDISQLINFPVFNLSDIAIVLGWILLIIAVVKDMKNGALEGK